MCDCSRNTHTHQSPWCNQQRMAVWNRGAPIQACVLTWSSVVWQPLEGGWRSAIESNMSGPNTLTQVSGTLTQVSGIRSSESSKSWCVSNGMLPCTDTQHSLFYHKSSAAGLQNQQSQRLACGRRLRSIALPLCSRGRTDPRGPFMKFRYRVCSTRAVFCRTCGLEHTPGWIVGYQPASRERPRDTLHWPRP